MACCRPKEPDLTLDLCRSSPAPALWLRQGTALEWEPNPAARAWSVTADWPATRWRSFAAQLGIDVLAGRLEGRGELAAGLRWRAVAAGPSGWIVWLLPAEGAAVILDATAQGDTGARERSAALSLRMLTEGAGLGTWSVDAEHQVLTWHGEMRALLGDSAPPQLPIAEAIERAGRHIHPDDRAQVTAGIAQVRDPSFESGEWSWRLVRDDGAVRWIVSRVRRQAGTRAATGVIIDVTEQREALERLRLAEGRTALAAEIAGFGVWQYDLVTRERQWDAQMYRLRGVDPATNPDLDTVRLATTDPEHMAHMQRQMDTFGENPEAGLLPDSEHGWSEFRVIHPDGTERWLAGRAMVLNEEGKNPRLLGLHWDVTNVRQAEQLLRDRLVAEESNRAKSRFLANMSHEIRTPMNAILGMAHLALRSALEPRQHNYVLKIERSAKALLGLINDILDYSKIEADKLDFESIEFRLGDVLDDLASLVGLLAEEKGLELVFALSPGVPGPLVGDPLRLGQVLTNLVGNAVKFTEQGDVTVAVEMPAPPADARVGLRFVVSDSGAGMTPQQLERLFQPFEQADASTSRQHGGTGLGLAISQRLVQAMGGTLEVESAPGQGSRFTFAIQFGVAPGAAADGERAPLDGMRVLVVDDNAAARQVALHLCGLFGLRAEAAFDSWDALRAVALAANAGDPFELVLLDADMPGMDGVSCATELMAQAHAGRALVLTSAEFGRDRVLRRLADAGLAACPVLTKPLMASALYDALAGALGRPSSGRRQTQRHASADQARRNLQGVRVLLVDDNDINQELAGEILRDAGLLVTPADHGVHAIELLRAQEFDIVLMDCQMPVMDGYEATTEIRREPRWATLPIMAMTANVMADDRARALASGMNDLIAKPIDIDTMFATLARWVGRTA